MPSPFTSDRIKIQRQPAASLKPMDLDTSIRFMQRMREVGVLRNRSMLSRARGALRGTKRAIFHWVMATLTVAAGAELAAAERRLESVGLTVGDLGNPFFVQIAKGAEAKARELGGPAVKFSAVSANYDLNLQTNQVEDFIASKV